MYILKRTVKDGYGPYGPKVEPDKLYSTIEEIKGLGVHILADLLVSRSAYVANKNSSEWYDILEHLRLREDI